MAQNEIIPASREVIAGKLLDSLTDGDNVAVLLNREDLTNVIIALECAGLNMGYPESVKTLLIGLAQLRKEAFE